MSVACPTLLFWGGRSDMSNPLADGRADHFKTVRTVGDVIDKVCALLHA